MWSNRWLSLVGRPVLMREVADAAGSGGAAPAGAADGADAGGDAGAAAGETTTDAGADPQGDTPADDDADDFDALDQDELSTIEGDPRSKRFAARHRKLDRFARSARPIIQTLRTMGVDVKTPGALAKLLQQARSYESFEQAAQQNPRLRALLQGGGDEGDGRRESARREVVDLPEDAPFQFDDSAFPWDRNDPTVKPLLDHLRSGAEERHHLRLDMNRIVNAMRALARDFSEHRSTYQTERRTQAGQQARGVVSAAAAKIADPELREAFEDAVVGQLQRARANGQRVTLQDAVDRTVKRFQRTGQMSTKEAARVAATQQQGAERNRSLPRREAVVGGQPASHQPDRSNETIWDVNKRLFGRRFAGGSR